MNKEKNKIKVKHKTGLTPITISIVSLSAFIMMLSIGISPNLMGNSVANSNKYTISYNSNGAIGSMKDQIVEIGKQAKLKKNRFELDGYTFNGWRAKRSDNKWLCYMDNNKVYNEWADISYCNKYGYSLFAEEVYVKDIVSKGDKLTLYADWKKSN